MKLIMQVIASAVASIVATWLLRLPLGSVDRGGEGAASASRGGPVVVVLPILAGNQWHINQPSHTGHRLARFAKRGA